MTAVDWEKAEKLSCSKLLLAMEKQGPKGGGLDALAKVVNEAIGQTLQKFNPTPVRITLQKFGASTLLPSQQLDGCQQLTSPKGDLKIWSRTDRDFDYLMCETLFGGSGMPKPTDEEGIKPKTKIETKVESLVVEEITKALAGLITKEYSVPMKYFVIYDDGKKKKLEDVETIDFIFDVEVFEFKGTLKLLMQKSALNTIIFNDEGYEDKSSRKVSDVVGRAKIDIEVYLQATQVPVGEILNLQIDQVIALDCTMNTDVHIHCVNDKIANGRFYFDGDSIAVEILSQALKADDFESVSHLITNAA